MRDRRRRLLTLALSIAALLAVAVFDGDGWRSPDQAAEQNAKVGGDAQRSGGRWEAAAVRSASPEKKSLSPTTSSGGGDDGALLRERFAPLLSESEKALLVSSLFVATSLLESAGVPYFLYGGTLLGSVRHHGLVPWDDDVDIMTNASQRDLVRAALSGRSDYALDSSYAYTYKFYSLNAAAAGAKPVSAAAGGQQFRWPYVDVFFFEENATHVHDSETEYSPEFVYRKADVFPLTRRPFEGGWLWTPRDSEAVLATTYDLSLCQTAGYMHRDETYVDPPARLTVECARLHEWFPFAICNRTATTDESERAKRPLCAKESLIIGGRVIHTLRMDKGEGLSHVS